LDKRLLIVLPLCLAIWFGWQIAFPPPKRPMPAPPTSSAPANADASAKPAPGAAGADAPPIDKQVGDNPTASGLPRVAEEAERELAFEVGLPGAPGNYRVVVTNRGGGIRELRTGRFFDRAGLSSAEMDDWHHWWTLIGKPNGSTTPPPTSLVLRTLPNSEKLARGALDQELWTMKLLGPESAPEGVEFTLAPGTGVTFVKRIRFVPGQDLLTFELELHNDELQGQSGLCTLELTPVGWCGSDSGDSYYAEPQAVAGSRSNPGDKVECITVPRPEKAGEPSSGPLASRLVSFAGVHTKYFAVLLSPQEGSRPALVDAKWRKLRDDDWASAHPDRADRAWRQIVADAAVNLPMPAQGETARLAFDVYAGPKLPEALEAAGPDLLALHKSDLGWVRWISAPLLLVLKGFHWITRSWGFSIILLTLLVRLILFPINRRSQTAMARYTAKMKRLQPRIDELKKRYANDSGKLRTEQAKLMQQEGAFPPLGGCLPMFLQIPVFIGLYRALGISFDLRQAPFLGWIPDLALPDRLLELDWHLPFLGTVQYLNILPPIMVGLWVWQQRMMPVPADEQAARMQKMMMFMPVLMGVFLYNYAAGLSLYMITQSGLGIFEMKIIRKYWPVDDKEVAPKKDGFWSRMLALQQEAERQKRTRRQGR
jgi:YidC/Oxa1 family membrane protein insertase